MLSVLRLLLWKEAITETCLYNFDPLKPQFYIVKLGFTGVYIIFLISAQNIDCGYSFETPCQGGSNEYPESMFWAEIWKNIRVFLSENFQVLEVKFSLCLNRRVFVMQTILTGLPSLKVCRFSLIPYRTAKIFIKFCGCPSLLYFDIVCKDRISFTVYYNPSIIPEGQERYLCKDRRLAMIRTHIARLPWLTRTRFWVPRKFYQ